jgi:hypothetical protein
MKITPVVKVGGVIYDVILVDHMRLEDECTGKLRTGRAIINLDRGLQQDLLKATEIHEIFEIIDIENQLGIKHRQLQCLATQWYQVIHDNPEIFKNE